MITLIAARDRNGAIGKGNAIPWHIPEDLTLFQRETVGGAIIMGRKTWDSLPVHPLKGRHNIVVSRQNIADCDDCANSVTQAIELAQKTQRHRIYGIGGAGIYKEMLPLANRLLITEVDTIVEDADTFFPAFKQEDWVEINTSVFKSGIYNCTVRELLFKGN
jgi:dihydrofolate reductase